MVVQRNYLAEAREVLSDDQGTAHERLRKAGWLFWQAYVYQGAHWPERLRGAAGNLLTRLIGGSRIGRNIESMDEGTVLGLSTDLLAFIREHDAIS